MPSFQFAPDSPEFTQDPYSTYQILREQYPLYYHADWDIWLVSRFADVQKLATDPQLVRTLDHTLNKSQLAAKRQAENWDATPCLSRYVRVNILDSEGEQHTRLRRLIFKFFTPASIEVMRPTVMTLVDKQIESIKSKSQIDFIADFVAPISAATIGSLLGIPHSDCHRLGPWSKTIVRFFEPDKNAEVVDKAERATAEFAGYLLNLVEKRHTQPENDLISQLVKAEAKNEISRDELISTCMILLMAGFGSTVDVCGTGMLALLQHPEQLNRLRNNPDLIKTAVQEMFRYQSPLPFFHRFLMEELEIHGQSLSKGSKIGLLYGAANRDPEHFEKAEQFDIGRSPNRHIAFGAGVHSCLGNHLARLEMEILFDRLLKAFPNIKLSKAEPEFKGGIGTRGLVSLPLTFR